MKNIITILTFLSINTIALAQTNLFVVKYSVAKNKQTSKVMVQLKFINYTDIISNYSINVFRKDAVTGWQKINTSPIVKAIASKESPFANDKSYQHYANFALRKIELDKEKNTKAFAGVALLNDNKMAEYAGCYFEDKNVEEGKTYQYKITNATKADEVLAEIITATASISNKKINDFSFKQQKQNILLNWQIQQDFFSYSIYRKTEGSSENLLLNKKPFTISERKEKIENPINYADLNLTPNTTYTYTLVAYDVLGNIVATADALKVVVKDLQMPEAVTAFTNERKGKSFILSWKPTLDKKCVGYNVYRNTDEDTIYKKVNASVLPIISNSFTDNVPTDGTAYSYYLESVGSNGNKTKSMISKAVMPDITAPAKPANVKGTTQPGFTTITWAANKEKDVKGYWVYRATTKKKGYFNIIHERLITGTSFTDTLPKTSTNDFIYKIQAVDFAYNKSEMSDTVVLNLPDVTAPNRVQAIEAQLNNNKVTINWSKAIDEDAIGYSLYKIINNEPRNVVKLNNLLLQDTKFIDNDIENNGNVIAYYVTVADRSNNISEPSAMVYIALPTDTTLQDAAKNVVVLKNAEDKSNTITWASNNTKKIEGFMVFRKSTEEENFVAISELINTTSFKDNTTDARVSYEYYIRTFFTNGTTKNSIVTK